MNQGSIVVFLISMHPNGARIFFQNQNESGIGEESN